MITSIPIIKVMNNKNRILASVVIIIMLQDVVLKIMIDD